MSKKHSDIPQEFIKKYVDELLEAAAMFGPDSAMGKAAMLRADHVMDLVKAFQQYPDEPREREQ